MFEKQSSVLFVVSRYKKKSRKKEEENEFTLDQGWLLLTLAAMFGNPFPATLTVHLLAQLEVQLFLSTHPLTDEKTES